MTTTVTASTQVLAERLIEFLETNTAPAGLFADDALCDLTVPQWRLQARGVPGLVDLRRSGHPFAGRVPRHRLDVTGTGFVLEVEETWRDESGENWYCRELLRADVVDGRIAELSVYCTGDWDSARVAAHAAEVTLLRP